MELTNKTSCITKLSCLKIGNSITNRTIHFKCAIRSCDSHARKCQYENNKNFDYLCMFIITPEKFQFLPPLAALVQGVH